ncbi:MAG TPA: hypothetical protein VL422_00310, partial [Miltoncostaea sp.]|nr:hypothetical protein [Miltoncostaea sp.]
VAVVASAAMAASAAPAVAARILPPGDRYGGAAVDLSTNGRAIVAYEVARPGPDVVRVAIRAADRLNRPTAGRLIGRGALELARVGGVASGPHLVVWRQRGELLASVLTRGRWRVERLPADVRSFHALSAAIAGSRVIVVAGDAHNAVAVVRTAPAKWVSVPLPAGPPRDALIARASEPSGRIVVAWREAGVAGPSVAASSFDPGALAWAPPSTLVAPGGLPDAVPDDLYVNGRGDAALSVVTAARFTGTRGTAAAVRILPALSPTWIATPDVAVASSEPGTLQVAVTPAGVPVYARLGVGVRTAFLGSGAWTPEEVAWTGPGDPDLGSLYAVDDLAVAQGGRVVASVAVDPGPGPDDHVFLVRSPGNGTWRAPKPFASLYGPPELIMGGRRVAASWVEDASGSGLPEAVLAPQ